MKSLEDALKHLLQNLGIENKVLENQVINLWPLVVGKKIASVSDAEKIEHNILFVKIRNDSWRNELVYYKNDLIKRLNAKIGKKIVSDIRFY